jgi:CelD/BcsL family acetyltransferase involved in cellulose biosynthesis
MPYRIEVVDEPAGFGQLRAQWDDLLERSGTSSIFQTWEWLSSWWEVFGGSAGLRVVTVRDGAGRLVGALPAQLKAAKYYGFPVRELSFVGAGFSGRQDVVLDSGHRRAVGALFRGLSDQDGWDIIRLLPLPENSALLELAAQDRVEIEEGAPSPFIRVRGRWEDYNKGLSKKFRGDIRNKTHRLDKLGSWAVRRVTEPGDGASLIAEMLALENCSHKPEAGTALLSRAGAPEFLRSFIRLAGARGWVDYATLDLDGRALGYLLGFVRNGSYVGYSMAYAPEAAEAGPGKLLMNEVIRWYFEHPGTIEEFDFSRGETRIKRLWCSEARRQVLLVAFRPGAYPALLRTAVFRVRPLIKRCRQWMAGNPRPVF